MTGKMPDKFIDHINGNKSDNRFCNLREALQYQNMQNQYRPQSSNKLGILGVYIDKKSGRYETSIMTKGKKKYIGQFHTAEEASQAYLEAKRKYHEFCMI